MLSTIDFPGFFVSEKFDNLSINWLRLPVCSLASHAPIYSFLHLFVVKRFGLQPGMKNKTSLWFCRNRQKSAIWFRAQQLGENAPHVGWCWGRSVMLSNEEGDPGAVDHLNGRSPRAVRLTTCHVISCMPHGTKTRTIHVMARFFPIPTLSANFCAVPLCILFRSIAAGYMLATCWLPAYVVAVTFEAMTEQGPRTSTARGLSLWES